MGSRLFSRLVIITGLSLLFRREGFINELLVLTRKKWRRDKISRAISKPRQLARGITGTRVLGELRKPPPNNELSWYTRLIISLVYNTVGRPGALRIHGRICRYSFFPLRSSEAPSLIRRQAITLFFLSWCRKFCWKRYIRRHAIFEHTRARRWETGAFYSENAKKKKKAGSSR